MDKAGLLLNLAKARNNAVEAKLEIVAQAHRVESLKSKGMDATGASIMLRGFINAERKSLKEMDWLLNQLDQLEAE